MNGVHDMGGMHGFGNVRPEADEPVFHAPWEGRVFGMQRAMGYAGLWNIDVSRALVENIPPHLYLSLSYYEKWLMGLESGLAARSLVGADEIAAGHALRPGAALPKKLAPGDAGNILVRGSFARPAAAPARFAPGARVRTKNINPPTHTRLPRYARGHVGTIEAVRGCYVFPDSVVKGEGENPQWLYTVVFAGPELWGAESDPALKVSIEAWECYLEPA